MSERCCDTLPPMIGSWRSPVAARRTAPLAARGSAPVAAGRSAPVAARRSAIATVLACACLAALAGPAGAAALSKESIATFQAQLGGGQVHAVVFHEKVHKMHVALNDGRKFTILYGQSEQQRLFTEIQAKGVSVKIAKPKPAKKKTTVHHKLRYIAGGIVIVVIVVVVAVLLIDRRRKRRELGGAEPMPRPQ